MAAVAVVLTLLDGRDLPSSSVFMPRIIPDGWEAMPLSGPNHRRIDTLCALHAGLPEHYTVYHAVHWTNVEGAHAIYGEIDFVIVNLAGQILVIEQKSGLLAETPDGLATMRRQTSRLIQAQVAQTVDALRVRLMRALNVPDIHLEHLLYCPDHTVQNPATVGIASERLVDRAARDRLIEYIQTLLPPGEATTLAPRVHRFLQDVIQLQVDVGVLLGEARRLVTRVAGGLAYWARQLEMTPYRLRVTGTAGSGKTQLALAEFKAALAIGKRPLYVCYNRPLADHFASMVPEGGLAVSFHTLCDRVVQMNGETVDFSRGGAFEHLVHAAAAAPVPAAYLFDTVIVDEGQDFSAQWRDMVLRHARDDARLLWLEDPMQNLYSLAPVELAGWVRLRAQSNYRSPRPVVRWLQGVMHDQLAIEAAAPVSTSDVDIIAYEDTQGLHAAVKQAIKRCYAEGLREQDVAVLSWRGHEKSQLLTLSKLGVHRFRSFTGRYDLLGQPVFTHGDILLESVYRFKGQSAPAVVLAEVDFDALDERAMRKLFVGATRATIKLIVVASARAAALLDEMKAT